MVTSPPRARRPRSGPVPIPTCSASSPPASRRSAPPPVKMPHLNKALSVGALVAVAGAAFLVVFTFVKKGGYSDKESYVVHALFSDATGLTWKSRVQIAGIQVGEVDEITLAGQRARLRLRVKKGVEL